MILFTLGTEPGREQEGREVDRETALAVLTRARVAPHQALRLINQAHRDLISAQGYQPGDIVILSMPRATFMIGRWR